MGIVAIEIEPEKEKQVEAVKLYKNNIISKIVLPRLAYKAIGSPKRIQIAVNDTERYILLGQNITNSSYFDIVVGSEVTVVGHKIVEAVLKAMNFTQEEMYVLDNFEFVKLHNKKTIAIKVNY